MNTITIIVILLFASLCIGLLALAIINPLGESPTYKIKCPCPDGSGICSCETNVSTIDIINQR